MTAAVIAVRDVTKTYGPRTVVDGLTFEVRQGTVTAFLGPNGAGKTTTIRLVRGGLDRGIPRHGQSRSVAPRTSP